MHRCRYSRVHLRLACAIVLLLPCVAMPVFASRNTAASGQVAGMPSPAVQPSPSPPAVAAQGSLEDAVASVVVVALTEQFDGKPISVNIDSYDVQVSGARERMVSGQGRVGVEGSAASITFNYRTVYDVLSSNAGYPAITISRFGAREHSVPNDAALIGELDERIASSLSRELGGKRVWLQFDSIQSFESDARYVRIRASGLADFGPDGSTPTRVEALYDRGQDAWLQVNYELGVAPASTGLASAGG
jgi:hypothetical protein